MESLKVRLALKALSLLKYYARCAGVLSDKFHLVHPVELLLDSTGVVGIFPCVVLSVDSGIILTLAFYFVVLLATLFAGPYYPV